MPWYTAKQMRENGQKQRHRQKRDFAVVDVSTTPSRKIHAIHVNNFYHLCACAIRENDAADRVETSFDISENNSTKNQGQVDNPTTQNLPGKQVVRGSSRLNASEFLEFLDPISFYSSPLLCRRSPKSSLDSWLHKNVLKRQQEDTSHNHSIWKCV